MPRPKQACDTCRFRRVRCSRVDRETELDAKCNHCLEFELPCTFDNNVDVFLRIRRTKRKQRRTLERMRIERRAGLSQEMLEERVTKETAVLKLDAGISRSDVAFSEDLFGDLAAGYFGPFMDDRELNALLPLETVESTLPGNIGSKHIILKDNLTSNHVENLKETATIVELLLLLKTSHKTDAPYTTFKEINGPNQRKANDASRSFKPHSCNWEYCEYMAVS